MLQKHGKCKLDYYSCDVLLRVCTVCGYVRCVPNVPLSLFYSSEWLERSYHKRETLHHLRMFNIELATELDPHDQHTLTWWLIISPSCHS